MQRDGGVPIFPEKLQVNPLVLRLSSRMQELHGEFPDTFETNFEYRICSQLLALPKTILELEKGENSVFEQVLATTSTSAKGIRRLLPQDHLVLYRQLILNAYKKRDIREVMMSEIEAVTKARSANLETKTEYNFAVVIIGAGGSGLTAARKVVEMGVHPSDILVVDRNDYIGGTIVGEDMMPFSLNRENDMQGPDILLRYQDLSDQFPLLNSTYRDGLLLNAYFAATPILLNHEMVERDGVMLRVDENNNNHVVLRSSTGKEKQMVAAAIDLAVGKQSGYGSFGEGEFLLRWLPDGVKEKAKTAKTFLEELLQIQRLLQEPTTITQGVEVLYTLLKGNIAIAGGNYTALQFLTNINTLLRACDNLGHHITFPRGKRPQITLYYADKVKKEIDKLKFLQSVANISYSYDRIVDVSARQGQLYVNREYDQNYGVVAFTGYDDVILEDMLRKTLVNNRFVGSDFLYEQIVTEFTESGRLDALKRRTRIFFAGAPFKLRFGEKHAIQSFIDDDGKVAVRNAKKLVHSLPREYIHR